jgi:PAS domain S-box-containing protein
MNNGNSILLTYSPQSSLFAHRSNRSAFDADDELHSIVDKFLAAQNLQWFGNFFVGQCTVNKQSYGILISRSAPVAHIHVDLIPASIQVAEDPDREKRLRFFESILSEIPTNIAIFDINHRYLFINKAGVSDPQIREWLIGKTDLEYSVYRQRNPAFVIARSSYFKKCVDTRSEVSWEEKLNDPSGKTRYYLRRYFPVLAPSGEIDFIIGYGLESTDLRVAELKLSESQEKYKTLIEHSSDIIYTTDAEGYFTYANQGAEKLSGYPREKILTLSYTDLVREDFREKVISFYAEQLASNNTLTYLEFPIIDSSGKEKWIGQNVRLVFENNAFVGAEAFARDITERKNVEVSMLAIVSSLDDVVMRVSEKYVFLDVWTKDDSILFMPKSELIGRTFREVLGDFAMLFEQAVDDVSKTGMSLSVEYKRPGTELWYNARFTLLNDITEINKTVSVLIEDITEKKVASTLFEQNRANLAALIDNTEDKIWAINKDFRLLSYNTSFVYHMRKRWKWEAAIGEKLPLDLFDSETAQFWISSLVEAFAGECFVTERVRNISKQITYDEFSFNPIRDKDNKIIGAAIFSRNITERKLAEEELKKARHLAEKSSQIREQFIANMSHEIRTPINAIIGSAHLLMEENLPESQRYFVSTISESSRFLLSTINDVLDLSKIDSGKLELDKSEFTIASLLQSLELTTSGLAKQKGLKLTIEADKDIPALGVIGDKSRLLQVLINLTANAIKFTAQGTVSVRVEYMISESKKSIYTFYVRDTGIGISREQIQNIFKPFSQANNTIAKKYGGTGLGLTISQKIIDALHGDLQVVSEPGKGSLFYFSVPLQLADPETPVNVQNHSSTYGGHGRVLVVDDNDFNRLYLGKLLDNHGIEAVEANDAEEALIKFSAAGEFDLILMDLRMPGTDGYTALKNIRSTEKGKRTKVWAYTANVMKQERDKATAAGFDGFLSKPAEPEKIIELISKIKESASPEIKADLNIDLLKKTFSVPEVLSEIINNLDSSLMNYIKDLEIMIGDNRFELLYELFHKIKPTAAMLRMSSVHTILSTAGEMKECTQEQKKNFATNVNSILIKNLDLLRHEMKHELK